jgi:hypothetical protein
LNGFAAIHIIPKSSLWIGITGQPLLSQYPELPNEVDTINHVHFMLSDKDFHSI